MEREINWLAEIKKENKQAFKSVYDTYADKVFYVALHFHLGREEAKEVVQEVFLTLWEKRSNLKEDFSLNAFLLTITKNKIMNLHKKKAADSARAQTYMQYHDSFSSSTEDYIVFSDLEKCTIRFIESLPPRKKQIFLLSRKEGLSHEEIASHLNISRRTVENNIYQAEKAIRHFLQENHMAVKSLAFFLLWFEF